jgi:hypothetical protein
MLDAPAIPMEQPHTSLSRRSSRVTHQQAKQGLADEQISFIIFTRDNNKPDPYGQHSCEYRPLPWPAVAQAYNKRFCVNIGSAAMEKRARLHRGAWMAVRPDYPRNIVYTKKDTAARSKATRQEKIERAAHTVTVKEAGTGTAEAVHESEQSETGDGVMTRQLLNQIAERSTRVAGWVPPDRVRNHGIYEQADEPEENEESTIELCDEFGESLCLVRISMRDLVRSSGVAARMWSNELDIHDVRIRLPGASEVAVQRYATCISPKFTQLRDICAESSDGDGTQYVWDFNALASLYNIATVLEDSNVRQLVLVQWQDLIERSTELELAEDALNSLFDNTRHGDPARAFWANAVFSAGLYDEGTDAGNFHHDLVMMMEQLMVDGNGRLSSSSSSSSSEDMSDHE